MLSRAKIYIKKFSCWINTTQFICAILGVSCCQAQVVRSPSTLEEQILFASNGQAPGDRKDDYALYSTSLSGVIKRRLTTLNDSSYRGFYTHDGKKIVYMVIMGDRNYDICTIDRDGKNKQILTTNDGWDGDPSYSFDGKSIIYVSVPQRNESARIVIMDANGKNQHPFNLANLRPSSPTFSPDRKTIAFSATSNSSNLGRSTSRPLLYIISIDGAGLKRLSSGHSPSWSQDGNEIVFVDEGGLWCINIESSSKRKVTLGGSGDDLPSFSPDGKGILFSSRPSRRSARAAQFIREESGEKNDIYLVSVDGKITKRLTSGKGNNVSPAWNPAAPRIDTASFLRRYSQQVSPKVQLATTADTKLPAEITTTLASGHLIYAFNDLEKAPYPSYLLEQCDGKQQAFRIRGLEGTEGDFVFDPLLLPNGNDVLLKLGDPVARRGNPYNSYRLWIWNRQTNELKKVGTRSLFFPSLAISPDGRYLAYVGGGDAEGTASEDNPLTLYLYDRNTAKESLVAQNDGLRGGFAWQNNQTLLYTSLPAFDPKNGQRPAIRPDIYSFSLENAKSRLLMRDGARPTPSSDGKRIAFFGLREGEITYPLSEEWWLRPSPASLAVMESDGSGRKTYGVRSGPYPSIVWAPDNQRLFFVRQTKSSPQAQANVGEWNVVSGRVRSVADLTARDAEEVERSWSKPQFRAVDISPDGKTLFVGVEEQTSSGTIHTLKAIDLQDGKSTPVASLKNDAGFNWKP